MTFDSRLASTLLLALPLAGGCVGARPDVEAEKRISDAIALPGAVVFHTEGGPIDVPPSSGDALSLAEALRRAVETSPELQAALARVRAAEAESDLSRLLPNPVLDFALRFPEGGGKTELEGSLSADLLAILQRPRRSNAAAHRLEAEAASALATAVDVVAETEARYSSVQVLEELALWTEARAAVLDRLRDVSQTRLDLGEGTRHDVTTLDAERMALAVEASQHRRELLEARLVLARRIGEPSGPASWKLDPWTGPAAVPTEETPWIGAALSARPEVLAIQWELSARGEERAIAGSGAWDGLAVGVDGQRSGGVDSLGPSIAAPIPVFDCGSERARRAAALESEVRHRLTEARRGVVEDVRTALAELEGAQQNLERVVRELIPLEERRRSEIEEAFRSGFVDVTALLVAEQALQESQSRRIGLEREVSAAHRKLERAVGGTSVFRSVVAANERRADPFERKVLP